jgi:beta-xylosidase
MNNKSMSVHYKNPVWTGYFADPFILKHENSYYAYGTGPRQEGGRVFPLLRSRDLVHWEEQGGALTPLPDRENDSYWAPEVAENQGKFYLYYSVADPSGDEAHRLRVAVADTPLGPFQDTGQILLPQEDFTIDAHPFCDPADGKWYLLFARDYFDQRAGTALAGVRLADDMVSVASEVTPILRASADWQIYERNRRLYGRRFSAWHTLEGPFIVPHAGRYYCFYSGGSYQNTSYGVGYAVADHPLGPYQEPEEGAVVLHSVPGHVIGPGHNSVVLGPDQRTEFLVYHAWDAEQTARRMCIDPLIWTPAGPRCAGPTWTEQSLE